MSQPSLRWLGDRETGAGQRPALAP